MSRGITAALLAALRDHPEAIVLLSIETKDSPSWIRFANQEADVEFNSETYSARPFGVGEVRIDGSEFPALELAFYDADLYWDTWLQTTDFRGHRATVEVVTRDTMATAANVFSDTFRILNFHRAAMEITFVAQQLRGILSQVQRPRSMSREEFPGIPNQPVGG